MGTKLKAVSTMADDLGVDLSYLAKVVRESKVKTTRCRKNGHSVRALTLEQWASLMKEKPTLQAQDLGKNEITVVEAAEKMDMDVSNLRKTIKRLNLEAPLRRAGGRATPAISKAVFATLKKRYTVPEI